MHRRISQPQSGSLDSVSGEHTAQMQLLQKHLLVFSFVNLFLVSLMGVWLRLFPVLPPSLLLYKNILHGHSHFALGGWVMPILLALILRSFPHEAQAVAYKHWRNIAVLLLLAAYGMLLSFPAQGYGPVSIFFSTLSVAAGFYLAFVVWSALQKELLSTAHLFLKWSMVYLVLSAAGPLAVGFFAAAGKGGTPLYFDAVYYYLHFQYNGFFTFAVLAVFYQRFYKAANSNAGRKVFMLLNWACIPAFLLSVLWHQPGIIFNYIGGVAALLQAAALLYLWSNVKDVNVKDKWTYGLLLLSMIAFALKVVLQLGNALPALALFAYQYRNITIAYLHLVLLGFITLFCFAATFHVITVPCSKIFKRGLGIFVVAFICTELLLVLPSVGTALGFTVGGRFIRHLLMGFSLLLPVGILKILLAVFTQKEQLH